jgi:hypothetical protein
MNKNYQNPNLLLFRCQKEEERNFIKDTLYSVHSDNKINNIKVWCTIFRNYIKKNFPTKKCIKIAPYLDQQSANLALNMLLYFALVLMLLNKYSTKKVIKIRCQ